MLSPKEETNVLQEPMEEEIAQTGSPLDEKEEESDEQKEEEWSSYPCLPSNESGSLTHTISYLFDCPPCLPKEDECYIHKCDDPIDSLLKNKNDAHYKSEICAILKHFFDNYEHDNGYNTKYLNKHLNRSSPPMEETNALHEPMEEKIAETGSSLDEKEEESDDQDGKNGAATHVYLP